MVKNKINGKVYVGQSVEIETRWRHEIEASLRPASKEDSYFIRALRKYGAENFEFFVLEECEQSKLDEREIFYIAKYNSKATGYNSTLGGQSGRKVDYELFKSVIENNPNISDTELAKQFGIVRETAGRIRKRLSLKREFVYESLLSNIRTKKDEIISLYNQDFSVNTISKKLNLDGGLLLEYINKELKLPKRQHLYKKNSYIILYRNTDGSFVKKTTKSEFIKEFGNKYGSLYNKAKSDYGYVLRFYKKDYPLVLKKTEKNWFEYWKEEK